MSPLPGIVSLLAGAAGWYYLFYSRAAQNLGGVEEPRANLRRVRLRRINGLIMLLFGGFFYAGNYTVDFQHPDAALFVVWLAVAVLILLMVILAFADVRLTAKLRRRRDGR